MSSRASLLAILLLGCGPSARSEPVARAAEPLRPRALVVGIDGLRPDALAAADAPHLHALFARGRASLAASTQRDAETSSAPGWASVLTGVEPTKHLVTHNGREGAIARDAFPTFLERARRAGHRARVLSQDPRVTAMLEPELAERAREGDGAEVSRLAAEVIRDEDVAIVFLVLEDVDDAGHATRFSAEEPAYLRAIARVDAQLGRVLDAIDRRATRAAERWLIAVTSDHAGDGAGHGARTRVMQTIPLAFAGDGIAPGELAPRDRSHLHVAPTVLAWIGVLPAASWRLDGHAAALSP